MDRVAAAMRAVPRVGHLPAEQREFAGQDVALPLFSGQTNSQPSTVRQMLELLAVPDGARVLDVGAGSGWTTAILAQLVGATGSVLGVELNPELAVWGAQNLADTGSANARLEMARPGVLGAPEEGPYDRILVSAMADELPAELVDQLLPGGVLVIPVAGQLWRVTKNSSGETAIQRTGRYAFVPLIRP